MPALYGTVTFVQMYNVTVGIADDLYFDMFRVLQIFFKVDLVTAEGFECF